jgi:hypothetical protein
MKWALVFAMGLLALAMTDANAEETVYLFSYFKEPNGVDGLHLAWSEDGYTWRALKNDTSFLKPTAGEDKLMRDPSLLRGPEGTFHMVWTTSWHGKTIGYASSKDLIHWSEQQTIPVMAQEADSQNSWAPELCYDTDRREFLIVWSSAVKGKFDGQHRSYAVRTKDFKMFTPARLFFDPGFAVIDDTIVPFAGKYYLVFKDERDITDGKTLKLAVGASMGGPWGPASKPFTRRMVEGPTWLKIGDEYIVYYDCFADHHYGALKTRDFVNWEDVTGRLVMPSGIRHGTALSVPRSVVTGLLLIHRS